VYLKVFASFNQLAIGLGSTGAEIIVSLIRNSSKVKQRRNTVSCTRFQEHSLKQSQMVRAEESGKSVYYYPIKIMLTQDKVRNVYFASEED